MQAIKTHKHDFKNIISACWHIEQGESSKELFRPIDKELLLEGHKQDKLKEAYQILEVQNDMTDYDFKKKLFHYQNSVIEGQGEEGRRLKDEYNKIIRDTGRIVAKMELKGNMSKGLKRGHKFIQI